MYLILPSVIFILLKILHCSHCSTGVPNLTDLQTRVYRTLDSFIPTLTEISETEFDNIKYEFLNRTVVTTAGAAYLRNWTAFDTLWCGPGTAARTYLELSPNGSSIDKETDKCCQSHDQCPISIDPGQTECGVTNKHSSTMSLCSCDSELGRCLLTWMERVVKAESVGFLFGRALKYCVNYDSAGTCTQVPQTWDWTQFDTTLMNRMKIDDLLGQIGYEPVKGYSCLTSKIFSGQVDLERCKVTCAIVTPFTMKTENLAVYDCSILNQLCCVWKSDFCHKTFPSIMGLTCREKKTETETEGVIQPQTTENTLENINHAILELRRDMRINKETIMGQMAHLNLKIDHMLQNKLFSKFIFHNNK